jgi:hypothetical protein
MPSPFPGMDPFLEDQGYWKELHTKYLNGIQDAIAERISDSYEVRLEERLSLIYETDSDPKRNVWPDVAILGKSEVTTAERPTPGAIILEPVTLPLLMYQTEEVIEHRIEIRRFPDRELVTVIELLSPSNERSIDYKAPLGLPLSPEHRAWAEAIARDFDPRMAH